MFGFLKEKLKGALAKISKKVEEEPEVVEKPVEEKKEEVKKFEKKEPKVKQKKKQEQIKDNKKSKSKKIIEKEDQIEDSIEVKEESVKIEEISQEVKIQEVIEEKKQEKKGFFSRLKEKFIEPLKEEPKEPVKEEIKVIEHEIKKEQAVEEIKEEKKGFFKAIGEKFTTTKISSDKFDELFSDLEIVLLENNVAFEVVDKIKNDLKNDLVDKSIKRGNVEEEIIKNLKESIEDLFLVEKINILELIKNKQEKPFVICFVGINGSGKTTTIAKITNYLQKNKKSVVLAAADTFRAAAIQQIKEWGSRLNVKVIAHDYGSDPAAVSFDAISYAKAHNIDVVLIDTAGRLHSNKDLIREMEKIVRVSKPDLKLFIGEAITGSDCIEQAKEFNSSINIDGIILSKADIDEKGGATISTSYVVHKPILFLGTGQELDDLKEFDKEDVIKSLGL